MVGFWKFFLRHRQFSYLLIAALTILGFFALFSITKESSPEVEVPIAIVTTILPGASASEVEVQITDVLEDQLFSGISDLVDLTSTSQEGFSIITVEFDPNADVDESVQAVKEEVDEVAPELPNSAEDPVVSEVDLVNQPVLTVSLSSDLPLPEFFSLVKRVEDELRGVSGVSRIERSGIPEPEILVVVERESLLLHNLSLAEVIAAITQANSSLPVGSVELDGVEYGLRLEGDLETAEDVRNAPILTQNGNTLYIRDLARVYDGFEAPSTLARISLDHEPSQQAVSLNIFKQTGEDVTDLSDAITEKVTELEEGLLAGTPVLISFDTGDYVRQDLRNLSLTALQTVLLVIIILLLALGWREALIAGIAIPLSFLISFIGLYYSGNTINFVSLFSLILAVGILVDSAIVITEAIHTKLLQRETKEQAAEETLEEFSYPVISGTATTIAVFVPLFFISGIVGEFIKSIPFTIVFVLVASLFVALAIVPLLAMRLLRRFKNQNERPLWARLRQKQEEYTHRLQAWYRNRIGAIIGNRKKEKRFLIWISIALVVALALPFLGLVQVIFFPQEDLDFLFVEIEASEGTVLEETDLVVRQVEEVLYDVPAVESFITVVGAGSAFTGGGSGEQFANVTLILSEDRRQTSTEVRNDLAERLSEYHMADIEVTEPSSGPPVGAPVLVRFLGDDLDTLEATALEGLQMLEDMPGTRNISSSLDSSASEFSIIVDKGKAASYGLSTLAVAQTLRTAVFGTVASTIHTTDEDVDVRVMLNLNPGSEDPHQTTQTTIEAIRQVELSTPSGSVFLGSLADISLVRARGVISHEDRERVVTISSEVEAGTTPIQITQTFQEQMTEAGLPDGITMSIGGETEETTQSFKEMGYALILGMLLIVTVLVLQFNSFKQAFIIISIVPFALIGVFFGLFIARLPISFPSIMGFIALSGIVVNNSIILLDVMNTLRKKLPDADLSDVVLDGATSRLRPILLTSLTTIIGVIPLTYASALWSPLAFALMFGLAFSVIITLVLVPILYRRWMK